MADWRRNGIPHKKHWHVWKLTRGQAYLMDPTRHFSRANANRVKEDGDIVLRCGPAHSCDCIDKGSFVNVVAEDLKRVEAKDHRIMNIRSGHQR